MNIAILGYFGYRTNQLDGQTVKTRMLRQLIEEHCGKVAYYDTQEFKYRKLSLLQMFLMVAQTKHLVYLPAYGNLKYIFPIVWIISKLCRTKIHYFVVGGWLREYLSKLPIHRYMLRHISGIYTETMTMKNELEKCYGFNNVQVFTNFRYFDFQPSRSMDDSCLKVVFMARINKMKGLDMIFNLCDYIIENKINNINITFYGQIQKEDEEYFVQNIAKYDFISYNGPLQPEEIHCILDKYDIMLLPTHYFTEGLPGSVVDAYISGIPVIVTEWKHAHEFVDDNINGVIIPFNNGQTELNRVIMTLLSNKELLNNLKQGALQSRDKFSATTAWNKLKMIFQED